jgi:hypothetical protein
LRAGLPVRTNRSRAKQKDEPLFKVHLKIDVPPLREAELSEVVRLRPD